MKTLKLIIGFLVVIVLAFIGVTFVEANRDEVLLTFGKVELPPTPLGFVVLTSVLFGMIVSGLLCIYEIASLHVIVRSLRKKLDGQEEEIESAPLLPAESSPLITGEAKKNDNNDPEVQH